MYHEAKVSPLIQEVAVYVNAVRFGEVLGDHLPDCGEVGGFLGGLVSDVAEVWGRSFRGRGLIHDGRIVR